MCQEGCSSDNCHSCQGDLYGLDDNSDEAIALCEDAGCHYSSLSNCYISTECDEDNYCEDVEICDYTYYCERPCLNDDGEVNCGACAEDTCEAMGCMWVDTSLVNGGDCDAANFQCVDPCGNGD